MRDDKYMDYKIAMLNLPQWDRAANTCQPSILTDKSTTSVRL